MRRWASGTGPRGFSFIRDMKLLPELKQTCINCDPFHEYVSRHEGSCTGLFDMIISVTPQRPAWEIIEKIGG
jgi:hypothetical protein